MTEHNHRRNTIGNIDHTRWYRHRKNMKHSVNAPLADKTILPKNFGIPDGPKDAAKANKGAKKYVRSRTRFHENAALKQLVKDESYD